jgi:polysaccharide export outer membrane protein
MRFSPFIVFILFLFILTSCHEQKTVPYNYLENVRDTIGKDAVKNFEPVIQKKDLLSIQVYTTTTAADITDKQYNLPQTNNANAGQSAILTGYLVDQDGNIEFPKLGTLHVEGSTAKQLSDLIKSKIVADSTLSNPSVIIRFLNYRVTVLGEVGHAGVVNIPYERVTIMEAIGLAGDIPLSGKKTTVKIIREINGDREIGHIDLTSKDMFDSPYYYLMQNDIVIVEPRKSKLRLNDQSIVAQRISFALTLITSAALLYSIFK